jgi:nitroreductase
MKFKKVLEERRSIRRYLDKPVEKEDLLKVLKAATLAPSWKNSQSWRFYAVTNDQILASIKENALPAFNAKNCAQAPVLIVACFEEGKSGRGADGEYATDCGEGWSYYDLGLACENLCLQAQALGLGTLIMGLRNEKVLKQILSIPENQQVVAVISLGYPDIEPSMPKRLSVEEVTKFFE